MDTQPFRAFHISTGRNTSVATAHATYGPHSAKRGHSCRCDTKAINTPIGSRMDVYFEENERPSITPAQAHDFNDSALRSSDCSARMMKKSVSAVNASSGAS